MKNGIYSLSFRSGGKDFGSGVLVVEDGLVNGGDATYSYNGTIDGNRLTLNLKKYNLDVHSFFGDSDLLRLHLIFHDDNQGYMLSGNVENMQSVQLLVQAKKIDELA